MKFHSLVLGVSVAHVGMSGVATAQETSSAPAASAGRVLEEVVVTAERRTESLQTTPISATVLTGDDLAKLGVNIVDQLQFVTPGAASTISARASTSTFAASARPSTTRRPRRA